MEHHSATCLALFGAPNGGRPLGTPYPPRVWCTILAFISTVIQRAYHSHSGYPSDIVATCGRIPSTRPRLAICYTASTRPRMTGGCPRRYPRFKHPHTQYFDLFRRPNLPKQWLDPGSRVAAFGHMFIHGYCPGLLPGGLYV